MESLASIPESILLKAATSGGSHGPGQQAPVQVMDKFMQKIISMALPMPSANSNISNHGLDERVMARIEIQKTRPALSIPIMSKNSVLLLQRLSIPFETIDSIIRIMNWEDPLWNLTIGLIGTLMVLKPINFITLPLVLLCFQVIVPAYVAKSERHWEAPKPVNEFSREFLLNVTDLQNHMLLYVRTWDILLKMALKFALFEDKPMTWMLFTSLMAIIGIIEAFGAKLLWYCLPAVKLLVILALWTFLISLHPQLRLKFLESFHDEELRLRTLSFINRVEDKLNEDISISFKSIRKRDLKKMIIYELQCWSRKAEIWQFVCFSDHSLPSNCHLRKSNHILKGAESLSDIVPPKAWHWANEAEPEKDTLASSLDNEKGNTEKELHGTQTLNSQRKQQKIFEARAKSLCMGVDRDGWMLDMDPSAWVTDNLLNDVVDIDMDTKWVYDKEVTSNIIIRRRRWVRYAYDTSVHTNEDSDEDNGSDFDENESKNNDYDDNGQNNEKDI